MATIEQEYRRQIEDAKEDMDEEYVDEDNYILPVAIIDNDAIEEKRGRKAYINSEKSGGYGEQLIIITEEHIVALKEGKALAVSPQHEYDVFIILKE